jgi:hypothetical protein
VNAFSLAASTSQANNPPPLSKITFTKRSINLVPTDTDRLWACTDRVK